MKQDCEALCLKLRDEITLFRYLPIDELRSIACYFKLRRAAAGEIIWREGDSCDYVAFIVAGRMQTMKETEFEGKRVTVAVYSKGSVVGELCILDGHPRAVTAVALEDITLMILTRQNLERLLEEHPRSGVKFLKGMLLAVSTRLRKSYDRLVTIF